MNESISQRGCDDEEDGDRNDDCDAGDASSISDDSDVKEEMEGRLTTKTGRWGTMQFSVFSANLEKPNCST